MPTKLVALAHYVNADN